MVNNMSKKEEIIKKDSKEEKIREEEIEEATRKAKWDTFLSYGPFIIIIIFVVVIRMFIATPVRVNGSSMSPTLENKDIMLLYKLTKHTRGIRRFDIVVINTDSGRLIKRVIGLPGEKVSYRIEKDDEDNEIGVLYINSKKQEETFIIDATKSRTCDSDVCPGNGDGSLCTLCASEITVGEDEYFVMGDNRSNSKDSRTIGTIDKDDIMGTTEIVLFPFNRTGKVK